MFVILSLIVLVAAFNIVSSLIMLVRAKTRDMAILRTMGAPRDAVLRIFMAIGLSIGIAGTAVGMIIGFSLLYFRQGVLRGAEFLTGQPLRSEEHTSELQSLMRISYAVFCLIKQQHNTL